MEYFIAFSFVVALAFGFAMGYGLGGLNALEWERKQKELAEKRDADRTILRAAQKVLGE